MQYGFDGAVPAASKALTFNGQGQLPAATNSGNLTLTPTNGAAPIVFSIDYNGTTQFAGEATSTTNRTDGYASGTYVGVELAADGSVLQPATYRTETRQQIVRPRSTAWTETPCPAQMTPEFIASVQRALAARGYFSGITTGRMDGPTLAAIRLYQADLGIAASTLTLDAARKLGLIAVAG